MVLKHNLAHNVRNLVVSFDLHPPMALSAEECRSFVELLKNTTNITGLEVNWDTMRSLFPSDFPQSFEACLTPPRRLIIFMQIPGDDIPTPPSLPQLRNLRELWVQMGALPYRRLAPFYPSDVFLLDSADSLEALCLHGLCPTSLDMFHTYRGRAFTRVHTLRLHDVSTNAPNIALAFPNLQVLVAEHLDEGLDDGEEEMEFLRTYESIHPAPWPDLVSINGDYEFVKAIARSHALRRISLVSPYYAKAYCDHLEARTVLGFLDTIRHCPIVSASIPFVYSRTILGHALRHFSLALPTTKFLALTMKHRDLMSISNSVSFESCYYC